MENPSPPSAAPMFEGAPVCADVYDCNFYPSAPAAPSPIFGCCDYKLYPYRCSSPQIFATKPRAMGGGYDDHGFFDGQQAAALPGGNYFRAAMSRSRGTGRWTQRTMRRRLEADPWPLTPEQSILADRLLYGKRERTTLPALEAMCPGETMGT